jgi:hypothetical protein
MKNSSVAGSLTLTRQAVLLDGRRVAYLRWSGRTVTVVSPQGKSIGRVMPEGYAQGRDGQHGGYDAWTAKHPSVHTPSDVIVEGGTGLTLGGCVALIIGEAG